MNLTQHDRTIRRNGKVVCETCSGEWAAKIVAAVNAHDDLVKACEAALELIGNMPANGRGFVGKLCKMKQCEDALAKARGVNA